MSTSLDSYKPARRWGGWWSWDWVVVDESDGRVPVVHYTPDSSLMTSAESLRPSQCSFHTSHAPSRPKPQGGGNPPLFPTLSHTQHYPQHIPLLKTTLSGKSLSPHYLSPSKLPPTPCFAYSLSHPLLSFLFSSFCLFLCDKWVLIKADRAMKLKEYVP